MTGKPLIVILGPTAVGKTGLALALAEVIGGEIIGADSRQVYRWMDIGTAKPTSEEQARVPHHLIDVVNPHENLSVAEYQKQAYGAIEASQARGHVPLLVGGTGQYISAVVEGWSIPQVAPNARLREELEAFATEHGSQALHARLAELDAAAAAKIDHQNIRRVVRALEVSMETGTPISVLQRKSPPGYRILQYGLTLPREALYGRADRRVDEMMAQGFLDEVRDLLARGYDRHLPSMSGLGYAQLAAHLLAGTALDAAIAATKHATHDFIRRQYTWFRKMDAALHWWEIDQTPHDAIIQSVMQWLKEPEGETER